MRRSDAGRRYAALNALTAKMEAHTREHVIAAIARSFGESSVNGVLKLLDVYGADMEPAARARIQLAIVKLADGDIGKVKHFVEEARMDYRDVLYWAEYYGDAKR